MQIKILGSGCAKCNQLEQLARATVAELGLQAGFEHVTEMEKIVAYGVMSTPALVVDDVVKVSGRIPGRDELIGWLKA
jgi:small redox-active disulfide protein 2